MWTLQAIGVLSALFTAAAMAISSPARADVNEGRLLPTTGDTTEQLLRDLDNASPYVRAAAIDLLGERTASAAIPKLIGLLSDGRALDGSDNWVGGRAANALSAITGRPFSVDQKEWQQWWTRQKKSRPADAKAIVAETPDLPPGHLRGQEVAEDGAGKRAPEVLEAQNKILLAEITRLTTLQNPRPNAKRMTHTLSRSAMHFNFA